MTKENLKPDTQFLDRNLSVYFYHWHRRTPLWILEPIWKQNKNGIPKAEDKLLIPDNKDYALFLVWEQAIFELQNNLDEFLKGLDINFEIEFHTYQNIPSKWKKICFSICPICQRSINIHINRPVKYCPICTSNNDNQRKRLKYAIKVSRKLCKYCKKPLPKNSPKNKDYCNRSHQQMDWVKRNFLKKMHSHSGDGTLPI